MDNTRVKNELEETLKDMASIKESVEAAMESLQCEKAAEQAKLEEAMKQIAIAERNGELEGLKEQAKAEPHDKIPYSDETVTEYGKPKNSVWDYYNMINSASPKHTKSNGPNNTAASKRKQAKAKRRAQRAARKKNRK